MDTPTLPQQLRGDFEEVDTGNTDAANVTPLRSRKHPENALLDVPAFNPRTANPQPRPWLINGVALRKQMT